MAGVDLPPEIQLRPGEGLVRHANSALESKWYLALILGTLLIGFGMDTVMAPLQAALRQPYFFSSYLAILPVIFLLLRLIWKSQYFLTDQRVMALSGLRWTTPTLHEIPVAGCNCRWFNRFGLTIRSPRSGAMRLAFIGMSDANGFAYDINQLGQARARAPSSMTGRQP